MKSNLDVKMNEIPLLRAPRTIISKRFHILYSNSTLFAYSYKIYHVLSVMIVPLYKAERLRDGTARIRKNVIKKVIEIA